MTAKWTPRETIVRADPTVDVIDFQVEQEGLKVTVKASDFRHAGESLSLSEDYEYTAQPGPHPVAVEMHLVKDGEGVPRILVDEIVIDGVDEAYDFSMNGCPFALLLTPLRFVVRPGSTSLDDASPQSFRVLPRIV